MLYELCVSAGFIVHTLWSAFSWIALLVPCIHVLYNFSSLFKPISAAFLGNDKLQTKMNVAKLLLFVWSHI